jgi:hypothetical protein
MGGCVLFHKTGNPDDPRGEPVKGVVPTVSVLNGAPTEEPTPLPADAGLPPAVAALPGGETESAHPPFPPLASEASVGGGGSGRL